MSTENDAPQGGGEAVVEIQQPATQKPPPKSDAEAAQREAEQAAQKPQTDPKPEDGNGKKPNRTGEYIRRLQDENRAFRERETDYQRRLEEIEKRFPKPDASAKPTREQFDFDEGKYEAAMEEWRIGQAQTRMAEQQKNTEAQRHQQERLDTYRGRIESFAKTHPDFEEVVHGIAVPLPPALQLAIMDHESGPEIAYHLGLNEDEAFNLAMVREGLEAHAIARLVSRMKAAPQPPATEQQPLAAPAQPETAAAALAGGPTPSRTPTTTQAPPPAPTVGGRAPVEVPPEKMTDDDWYKRDRERRRKR